MAYGDYSGPKKADKGAKHGSCNRSSCQEAGANWYNHGSYAWYCESCKDQIYDAWGRQNWAVNFSEIRHPQFETVEMMEKRGVTDVHTF